MLLRERVAEWLNDQDNVTNVRPVRVRLHTWKWEGAAFIRNGEEVYYLIGKRPKHDDPTCYLLENVYHEWYIGGYLEEPADRKVHPFGNHWILVPWIIRGDPESRIDDYADESYKRITLIVEKF